MRLKHPVYIVIMGKVGSRVSLGSASRKSSTGSDKVSSTWLSMAQGCESMAHRCKSMAKQGKGAWPDPRGGLTPQGTHLTARPTHSDLEILKNHLRHQFHFQLGLKC